MISARLHIARCRDYQPQSVRSAIQEAVEAIGGLPVKPGDKVLLKPNLLSPRSPEKAVTTHPQIAAAVAELVKDCGGVVSIGDSPSGQPGEAIWIATGMNDILAPTRMKKIDFTASGTEEFLTRGNVYYLAQPALECDLLINLPKLKTHSLTMFTGAVKNLYGCLPGFQKGTWHRRAPKNEQFSQVVVDVFSRFTPRVNIMDGVMAMEGDGPATGRPRKLGVIIASNSAPALDKVAAKIIGFGEDEILTTRFAEQRGFFNPENITLTGASIEEVAPSSFALPQDRYLRMIPHLLHEIMGRFIWSRPEVNEDDCIACGDCAQNCPVQAMSFNGGPPEIDYRNCINCFCCDEICPSGAIVKKMSWLAKRLA